MIVSISLLSFFLNIVKHAVMFDNVGRVVSGAEERGDNINTLYHCMIMGHKEYLSIPNFYLSLSELPFCFYGFLR